MTSRNETLMISPVRTASSPLLAVTLVSLLSSQGVQAQTKAEIAELQAKIQRADALRERGKYTEAISLYEDLLDSCRRILGPQHQNTAVAMNNLALLYDAMGRYAEAE